MLIVIKSCGMTTVPSEPDHSTRINTVRQLVKFHWTIPELPKASFWIYEGKVEKRTPLISLVPIPFYIARDLLNASLPSLTKPADSSVSLRQERKDNELMFASKDARI